MEKNNQIKSHLTETIKANRPNISLSSLRTYLSLLVTLYNKLDGKDNNFFNDSDNLIDYIKNSDKTGQTKKTLLSALYVLTKDEKYKTAMIEYSVIVNNVYAEKRTNEKRADAELTPEKIKEVYIKCQEKLKLSPTNQNYVNFLIVALTSGVIIAPRRSLDWIAMKVKNVDKKEDNYIQGNYFMFNKFKTSKFVKPEDKKILIPKDLKSMLNKWVKINDNSYLLYQKNNKPFTSSSFTKRLNKLYGTSVGVDLLRSTYLTNKFGNVADKIEELTNTTKEMGTSLASGLQYYIKTKD